jgi:mannose-6-phosphate isomerase-like protein (cupin superfamily)
MAKSQARKSVARKGSARKGGKRVSGKVGKAPRAKAIAARSPARRKAPPRQTFNVSHLREEDFRADGLRSYARYRDLGMGKATGGRLQAHVIRMVPPCDPAVVSNRHYHDVELQMIYVLKGWMKGEYEGQVVTLRQGSAWLQPPRIKHTVLDYSDDCELLEIIVPAEFDTVEVENIKID